MSESWIILPYSAFLCFALGQVWRFRHDRFAAIAVSTGDGRLHEIGTAACRYGMGALIAARMLDVLGSGPHMHPSVALRLAIDTVEIVALPVAVAGAVLYLVPAMIADPDHGSVSPLDRLTLPVLAGMLLSWAAVEFAPDSVVGPSRTADTLFIWFRSLFTAHPNAAVMAHAPGLYQLRGLMILLLIAIWPYTRLGGLFAGPLVRRSNSDRMLVRR
ncbi:respiratory nitrate reductase subunit gamma [Nocardia sp. NEAU-G5]|uniref:Respiratory nitrate reductase subunit gamma n=1 Tax=Nocardia albiluteola TaxID=2842303 RepID=A0ABS6AYW3_9NOCA|nr:respiratory nitrate reductase subunit gamma [Nocardia albiluteola]MBU3063242.1 respiratory nitrate reductase subunit gamma [Nocardia albiluteola]